jgi:hypothetical protein
LSPAANTPAEAIRTLHAIVGNRLVQRALVGRRAPTPARPLLQREIGKGAEAGASVKHKGNADWVIEDAVDDDHGRPRYRIRHIGSPWVKKIVYGDDPDYDLTTPAASASVKKEEEGSEKEDEGKKKEEAEQPEERRDPGPTMAVWLVVDAHLGAISADTPRNDLPIRSEIAEQTADHGLIRLRYTVGTWSVTVYWPMTWYREGGAPGPNQLGFLPSAEFGAPTFSGECATKSSYSTVEPFEYALLKGGKFTPKEAFDPTA